MNNTNLSFQKAVMNNWSITYLQSSDMLLVSDKMSLYSPSKEVDDGFVIYFENKNPKNIVGVMIEDITSPKKRQLFSNIFNFISSRKNDDTVNIPLEKKYFQDINVALKNISSDFSISL